MATIKKQELRHRNILTLRKMYHSCEETDKILKARLYCSAVLLPADHQPRMLDTQSLLTYRNFYAIAGCIYRCFLMVSA